jgi:hypothetical protein
VSTVLVLGGPDVGLLFIDGGLLLLPVGISPGIAVSGLPEGVDSVDRLDTLVHEESLGFLVQSGGDRGEGGGVAAV